MDKDIEKYLEKTGVFPLYESFGFLLQLDLMDLKKLEGILLPY